jgi:hypothetical protein
MTGASAQVEYFAILTTILPGEGRVAYSTVTRTFSVRPNATRADLYEHMRGQLPEHLRKGNTLFFSAEPNRRGVS